MAGLRFSSGVSTKKKLVSDSGLVGIGAGLDGLGGVTGTELSEHNGCLIPLPVSKSGVWPGLPVQIWSMALLMGTFIPHIMQLTIMSSIVVNV